MTDLLPLQACLAKAYPYLLHETSLSNLASIRRSGLVPSHPGGWPEPEVFARFGNSSQEIICLRPVGATQVKPGKAPPHFRVALRTENLPTRFGLDWSFPPAWDVADVIFASNQDHFRTFIEAAKRGSVVSYDLIPPEVLLVCALGQSPEQPSNWPLLVEIDDQKIQLF